MLSSAIRNRTAASIVQRDLTEMNLPPPFIQDFVQVVKTKYADSFSLLKKSLVVTPLHKTIFSIPLQYFVTPFPQSIRRFDLQDAAIASCVSYPTLQSVKWRIDICISSSSLSRVLKPTILMRVCSLI